MEKAYKGLQSENYALRDYVITLQARLLDATGDFPPPPPNVNINAPNTQQPQEHGMPEQQHEQQQPQAKWGASPLEAVARDRHVLVHERAILLHQAPRPQLQLLAERSPGIL